MHSHDAAGFVLTTVEAIGDITATEEASFIATVGEKHNKRIQGGLLGDGTPPPLSPPLLWLCLSGGVFTFEPGELSELATLRTRDRSRTCLNFFTDVSSWM